MKDIMVVFALAACLITPMVYLDHEVKKDEFKKCVQISGLLESECILIKETTGLNDSSVLLYKMAKESK